MYLIFLQKFTEILIHTYYLELTPKWLFKTKKQDYFFSLKNKLKGFFRNKYFNFFNSFQQKNHNFSPKN